MFLQPVETGTHGKCIFQGKKWISGAGSFPSGSHNPKGHLLAELAMTLSTFVSPFFSHCACRYSPCEHHRAPTAELCSRGAGFASWRRFSAIGVTPASKANRLMWQQPFPGSTAVSTPGTLLAQLHWAGGIYLIFRFRLTSACEQKFLM